MSYYVHEYTCTYMYMYQSRVLLLSYTLRPFSLSPLAINCLFLHICLYIHQYYGVIIYLQVVMKDGQSTEEGQAIANDLMEKLDIKESDLISGAYMDLILNNKQARYIVCYLFIELNHFIILFFKFL